MTCVYTGAVVHVTNYGATLICDLFRVGNVIIANEGTEKFIYDKSAGRPHTHTLTLGREALDLGKCIAAPVEAWSGEWRG